MRAPCKDCPKRHPICHDTCPEYQVYRVKREETYHMRLLKRKVNETFTDQITKQMRKKAGKG